MLMRIPIAQFQIQQHSFSLYFERHAFSLQLDAPLQATISAEYLSGKAWLHFQDEPSIDDVNQQIDAFAVSLQTRKHMLRYIQHHQLSYFYFHAATARKARIYPRIARLLLEQLPNYAGIQTGRDFYFYLQA